MSLYHIAGWIVLSLFSLLKRRLLKEHVALVLEDVVANAVATAALVYLYEL